jgi:solute carrier family 35 (GDP-fucose transporter), member C1
MYNTQNTHTLLNPPPKKQVLPAVNDNQWVLTFVNNLNAVLLFIPLILYTETDTILEHWSKFFSPLFWAGMTLSGLLGFAIGTVTVMQIKATSPLTHNISGTAKAAVQSIMAFYIWGNPATTKSVVGIALVLGGSSCYTYVAMKAAERKRLAAGSSLLPLTSPSQPVKMGA